MSVQFGFLTNATMPMAVVTRDGAALSASPSWSDMFGPALAAGVADADAEVVVAMLSAKNEAERTFDVRPRGCASKWMRLQATAWPEEDALLLVATDVTGLRAEVADLRDQVGFMEWQALSLSTFAKVMAHAPIVLFAMDRSGIATMCDGKGLELIGQRPGERVGRDELAASAGSMTHDHLLRALNGEAFRVLAEPVPGVYFETWYMPQRDENDGLDGVLSLSIDATDRVVSEQKLAEKMLVVERQALTIRDLAAPIIEVWQGVLCLPIIGVVDAPRAADMMERLLVALVREKARFAILDLTGVEAMDTATVHHTLRLIAAARTLGVHGILSGVRPAVAQSMAALGVDLGDLRTVRTLRDALAVCLQSQSGNDHPRRRHLA